MWRGEARAIQRLFAGTANLNELGWLNAARLEIDTRLAELGAAVE